MKAHVHTLDGKAGKEVELPPVFEEEIRPDLINRACLALRSRRYQPKGTYKWAGLETSADYIGRRRAYRSMINISRARLPKVKLAKGRSGDVRRVPQAKSGRRAHPPKVEKVIEEKINTKERKRAIRSAIAATADIDYVKKRGHKLGKIKEVPLIAEDSIEQLKKTKEVKDVLRKLNFGEDLKRGEDVKTRAGRGKTRGRRKIRRKSVLIVVNEDKGILTGAKNVPGVDVVLAKNINAELLAPGGVPGRLTIYSESAIAALKTLFK